MTNDKKPPMEFLASIRRFYVCYLTAVPWRSSGPAHEHIVITNDGSTHTTFFGVKSYGKGHVPIGGHMPITTVEYRSTKL